MAYQIRFENEGRGVVLEFSGAISGAEIIEAADRMYRDDPEGRLRYQIVDLTGASALVISEDQLRRIALLDKQAANLNPNQVVALVGSDAIFAGSDRRYSVYAEVWAGFETEFFNTLDEVREWLANRHPECLRDPISMDHQ